METEDGTFCYDKTGRAGTAGPTGQGLLMTAAAAAATAAGTAALPDIVDRADAGRSLPAADVDDLALDARSAVKVCR